MLKWRRMEKTGLAIWQSDENLEGVAGFDNDLFVSRSINQGVTWSAPELLVNALKIDTGDDFTPQLITDGTYWVAVWESDNAPGGIDFDIAVSISENLGEGPADTPTPTLPPTVTPSPVTNTHHDFNTETNRHHDSYTIEHSYSRRHQQ